MSFREKSAWVSLVTYGVVFSGYFLALWRIWNEGDGLGLSLGLMIGAVVGLIIVTVVLKIALALLSPEEAKARADEREVLIDLRAERIASYTLSTLVVCLIGALLVGWNGYLVANLLLGAMVISEVVKAVAQIASFRRGA
ncbi:MAG: hypothetical protein ACT4OF_07425 [Caulobacteraceae bacterium]